MARNGTTTRFGVDVTELQKGFQDAKTTIATANSEFKKATASMNDWSKSADGLTAKINQLTTVEAQEQKKT